LSDTLRFYRTSIPARFWEDLKSEGLLRADAAVPNVKPQSQVPSP
jgi:hypothetical protein